MPAARGVKRTASKSVSSTSAASKTKRKRAGPELEIPSAPTEKGRVVACGQGDVGQLGLGEDVVETAKFKFVSALGDNIVDICAGGMHSVALDSNGKVWTFGCNDEGALGRPTSGEEEEGRPRAVALPARAVAVAAGDSHSAALLASGDVYAWGAFRDSHGSMGLVMEGREGKTCREPVQIKIGQTAAGIASGGDHLVILTTSGTVFTMGCGEQGQLGRLAQRSASRDARQGVGSLLAPAKVSIRGGARRVWAGYHATLALSASDQLLAWGLNNYGQLGVKGEKNKGPLFFPTECDAFSSSESEGWSAVCCGQHHTLALDSFGTCYAIGRCEYGRLGFGEGSGDADAPVPIPKLEGKKCVSIAAGTCSSYAVTDSGEVLSWGMGSEGQLGTGRCEDAAAPAHAHDAGLRVAAGGQHALLLLRTTSEPETTTQPVEKEKPLQKPEKGKEKKTTKRQKAETNDDEDAISTTSTADVSDESKPQKVNGDENITTPMDVDDETDKPTTTKPTTKDETSISKDNKTSDSNSEPPAEDDAKLVSNAEEKSIAEEKSEQKDGETATKNTEEKIESKELNSTEKKGEANTEDVEMKEEKKVESENVNGMEISEESPEKSVKSVREESKPVETVATTA